MTERPENTETPQEDEVIERGWVTLTPWNTIGGFFINPFLGVVITGLVISGSVRRNALTVSLAVLGYGILVADAIYGTVTHLLALYGFGYKPVVRSRLTAAEWEARSKRMALFGLVKYYLYFAYAFALADIVVSKINRTAFNVGELSLGAGIYFSITTIATVGYGDIVPVSATARLLAVSEILVGLLFAVLVFSALASYLRDEQ